MKSNFKHFFIFLLLMLGLQVVGFAQRQVSGKITAENGEPLIGASILVKGSASGVVTDLDGNFSLKVPNDASILVVSYVGYTTQEIAVGAQSTVDIVLAEGNSLSEVVVTGYTSQARKDISGAVSVIKSKDIAAVPAGRVENQLQGRAAGVTVITSGQPGADVSVRIRGFSSFGNNQPLYIVDGVPGGITFLNANDIESIQVLKDAGAASIYGSRASNGVVIIQTKRGKDGIPRVSYDMFLGNQNPGKGYTPDLLNSQEMADMTWQALRNSGQLTNGNPKTDNYGNGATPVLPDYLVPVGAKEGSAEVNPALYNNDFSKPIYTIVKANKVGTDWYKEMTRNALTQNHNLSISGGTEKANYYLGLGYLNQQGIVLNTYLKRYSLRANSEMKVGSRIRVGENLQVAMSDNPSITNLDEGNVFSQSYRIQPIIPVYDIAGNFAGTRGSNLGNGSNPVAARTRAKDDYGRNYRLFGNVYGEVDLLKHLTLRSSFGGEYNNYYAYNFGYRTWENSENNGSNSLNETSANTQSYTWTNTLKYAQKVDIHDFTVLVGTEAISDRVRVINGSRLDFFSNDPSYRVLSAGASGVTNSSFNSQRALYSMFGRVDYTLNDKYIFAATLRRDGSSVFGDTKYGVFPSFSAAWRISSEPFMKETKWIDDLKIRASWGKLGSQLNSTANNAFNLFGGSAGTSYYDITGANSSAVLGFRQTSIGDAKTKWETNKAFNVGFDAVFFKNALELVVDYYNRKTIDLLYAPELPATAGAALPPVINVGNMVNKGIDIFALHRGTINRDLKYDVAVTFTTVKNTITKIADGFDYFESGGSRIGNFARNQVGHSLSSFYGYQVVGLFQSKADVDGSPTQEGAAPGRFKYQDTNKDGKITTDDRVFFGKALPDFTYGLNVGFAYKNFDIGAFFYGSQGNDIINYTRYWTDFYPSFQGVKGKDALYNSWRTDRTGGTTPILENEGSFSTNNVVNSYYKENGSYMRLKTLQLGYSLSKDMLNKIGINNLRLYVQGVNLFTVTKYKGIDPELGGNDTNFGIDYGNYPAVKQFIFGANVAF